MKSCASSPPHVADSSNIVSTLSGNYGFTSLSHDHVLSLFHPPPSFPSPRFPSPFPLRYVDSSSSSTHGHSAGGGAPKRGGPRGRKGGKGKGGGKERGGATVTNTLVGGGALPLSTWTLDLGDPPRDTAVADLRVALHNLRSHLRVMEHPEVSHIGAVSAAIAQMQNARRGNAGGAGVGLGATAGAGAPRRGGARGRAGGKGKGGSGGGGGGHGASHSVAELWAEGTSKEWFDALHMVATYLDNILTHPKAPKYRAVNTGNTLFARRVGALEGGPALLVAAGFRELSGNGGAEMKGLGNCILEYPAGAPLVPLKARLLMLQSVLPTVATFAQAELDKRASEPKSPRSPRHGSPSSKTTRRGGETKMGETKQNNKASTTTKRPTKRAVAGGAASSSQKGSAGNAAASARVHALEKQVEHLKAQVKDQSNPRESTVVEAMERTDRKLVMQLATDLGIHLALPPPPARNAEDTGESKMGGKSGDSSSSASATRGRPAAAPRRTGAGAAKKSGGKSGTRNVSSVLSSPAIAGATRIDVADAEATGFKPGDKILIGAGSDTQEDRYVLGFGSLILDRPLTYDHPAQTPITVVQMNKLDKKRYLHAATEDYVRNRVLPGVISLAVDRGEVALQARRKQQCFAERPVPRSQFPVVQVAAGWFPRHVARAGVSRGGAVGAGTEACMAVVSRLGKVVVAIGTPSSGNGDGDGDGDCAGDGAGEAKQGGGRAGAQQRGQTRTTGGGVLLCLRDRLTIADIDVEDVDREGAKNGEGTQSRELFASVASECVAQWQMEPGRAHLRRGGVVRASMHAFRLHDPAQHGSVSISAIPSLCADMDGGRPCSPNHVTRWQAHRGCRGNDDHVGGHMSLPEFCAFRVWYSRQADTSAVGRDGAGVVPVLRAVRKAFLQAAAAAARAAAQQAAQAAARRAEEGVGDEDEDGEVAGAALVAVPMPGGVGHNGLEGVSVPRDILMSDMGVAGPVVDDDGGEGGGDGDGMREGESHTSQDLLDILVPCDTPSGGSGNASTAGHNHGGGGGATRRWTLREAIGSIASTAAPRPGRGGVVGGGGSTVTWHDLRGVLVVSLGDAGNDQDSSSSSSSSCLMYRDHCTIGDEAEDRFDNHLTGGGGLLPLQVPRAGAESPSTVVLEILRCPAGGGAEEMMLLRRDGLVDVWDAGHDEHLRSFRLLSPAGVDADGHEGLDAVSAAQPVLRGAAAKELAASFAQNLAEWARRRGGRIASLSGNTDAGDGGGGAIVVVNSTAEDGRVSFHESAAGRRLWTVRLPLPPVAGAREGGGDASGSGGRKEALWVEYDDVGGLLFCALRGAPSVPVFDAHTGDALMVLMSHAPLPTQPSSSLVWRPSRLLRVAKAQRLVAGGGSSGGGAALKVWDLSRVFDVAAIMRAGSNDAAGRRKGEGGRGRVGYYDDDGDGGDGESATAAERAEREETARERRADVSREDRAFYRALIVALLRWARGQRWTLRGYVTAVLPALTLGSSHAEDHHLVVPEGAGGLEGGESHHRSSGSVGVVIIRDGETSDLEQVTFSSSASPSSSSSSGAGSRGGNAAKGQEHVVPRVAVHPVRGIISIGCEVDIDAELASHRSWRAATVDRVWEGPGGAAGRDNEDGDDARGVGGAGGDQPWRCDVVYDDGAMECAVSASLVVPASPAPAFLAHLSGRSRRSPQRTTLKVGDRVLVRKPLWQRALQRLFAAAVDADAAPEHTVGATKAGGRACLSESSFHRLLARILNDDGASADDDAPPSESKDGYDEVSHAVVDTADMEAEFGPIADGGRAPQYSEEALQRFIGLVSFFGGNSAAGTASGAGADASQAAENGMGGSGGSGMAGGTDYLIEDIVGGARVNRSVMLERTQDVLALSAMDMTACQSNAAQARRRRRPEQERGGGGGGGGGGGDATYPDAWRVMCSRSVGGFGRKAKSVTSISFLPGSGLLVTATDDGSISLHDPVAKPHRITAAGLGACQRMWPGYNRPAAPVWTRSRRPFGLVRRLRLPQGASCVALTPMSLPGTAQPCTVIVTADAQAHARNLDAFGVGGRLLSEAAEHHDGVAGGVGVEHWNSEDGGGDGDGESKTVGRYGRPTPVATKGGAALDALSGGASVVGREVQRIVGDSGSNGHGMGEGGGDLGPMMRCVQTGTSAATWHVVAAGEAGGSGAASSAVPDPGGYLYLFDDGTTASLPARHFTPSLVRLDDLRLLEVMGARFGDGGDTARRLLGERHAVCRVWYVRMATTPGPAGGTLDGVGRALTRSGAASGSRLDLQAAVGEEQASLMCAFYRPGDGDNAVLAGFKAHGAAARRRDGASTGGRRRRGVVTRVWAPTAASSISSGKQAAVGAVDVAMDDGGTEARVVVGRIMMVEDNCGLDGPGDGLPLYPGAVVIVQDAWAARNGPTGEASLHSAGAGDGGQRSGGGGTEVLHALVKHSDGRYGLFGWALARATTQVPAFLYDDDARLLGPALDAGAGGGARGAAPPALRADGGVPPTLRGAFSRHLSRGLARWRERSTSALAGAQAQRHVMRRCLLSARETVHDLALVCSTADVDPSPRLHGTASNVAVGRQGTAGGASAVAVSAVVSTRPSGEVMMMPWVMLCRTAAARRRGDVLRLLHEAFERCRHASSSASSHSLAASSSAPASMSSNSGVVVGEFVRCVTQVAAENAIKAALLAPILLGQSAGHSAGHSSALEGTSAPQGRHIDLGAGFRTALSRGGRGGRGANVGWGAITAAADVQLDRCMYVDKGEKREARKR